MANCTAPIVGWQCPAELTIAGCTESNALGLDVPGCFNTITTRNKEEVIKCQNEASGFSGQLNSTSRQLKETTADYNLCVERANSSVIPLMATVVLLLLIAIVSKVWQVKFPKLDFTKKMIPGQAKGSDIDKEYQEALKK
jgi:hypothetical protein